MAKLVDPSDTAFTVTYNQRLQIQQILGATPFSGDVMLRAGSEVHNADQLIKVLKGFRDELTQFVAAHQQLEANHQRLCETVKGGHQLFELLRRGITDKV